MNIRSPAVAGTFYPAAPDALGNLVRETLAAAQVDPAPAKAIVAPHAGYRYSGAVAASAFRSVAGLGDQVARVVLIGPSHYLHFAGLAVPSAAGFLTPLGTVAVDAAAIQAVLKLPGVQVLDAAYEREHALEVELPYIQTLFPRARVVPLLVGEADAPAVERVLAALWGGPETLIVVSSDLSHFLDYEAAQASDLATSQAIEALNPGKLDVKAACGHRALAGLLLRAARLDLRPTTRDLRNSGDTQGGRERVVGYGAYTFEYAHQARLPQTARQQLLDAAYATLRHIGEKGRPPNIAIATFPAPLRALRKTFVTLEIDGKLRGCVGSVVPVNPLIVDVVANSFKSATQDRRFKPMSSEELAKAKITIAVLSHPRPLPFASEAELIDQLRPEVDGLALVSGDKRALLLPKVWEQPLLQAHDFLAVLKRKARLGPEPLDAQTRVFRFTAETFAG